MHATERIYPSTEWTSSAARSVPSNVKSKVSAYDRKQKDLQGNNVLEKTDYAGYAQLRSKNVDVGELRRKMAGTDQQYSDIGLGGGSKRPGLQNAKSQQHIHYKRKKSNELMHAHANVFDKSSAMVGSMISEQNCSQKKMGMLRSSMDFHSYGPTENKDMQQGSMILSDEVHEWQT